MPRFTQRQTDNMRPGERRCNMCMEWKASTKQHYYPNKKHVDGCVATCIPCWKERYRGKDRTGKARREETGVVYFFRITEDFRGLGREGLIKFGNTTNLKHRLYAFRSQQKVGAELIGWVKGGLDTETEINTLCFPYRAQGREFVHPNEPLQAWMNQHCVNREAVTIIQMVAQKSSFERWIEQADRERADLMEMIAPKIKQLPLPLAA